MRYRVSPHWMLGVVCVLSVGLLGWSPRAGAQTLGDITGTVTGSVGTVTGTVSNIVGGTTTVLGGTGTLAAGSTDSLYSEADSISTSAFSADVPSARVIGYADEIASESYLASLSLDFGGITIAASSAEAAARAPLNASWSDGTSYVASLSVNGVDIPVDGTPNQTVSIPGGQLVINEQQTLSDGTVAVNALHATLVGIGDVLIGSATAGPSGGDAAAVKATTF